MVKISWTDRITNEEVPQRINENRTWKIITQKECNNWIYIETLRDPLTLTEGKVEGGNHKGKVGIYETDHGQYEVLKLQTVKEDGRR